MAFIELESIRKVYRSERGGRHVLEAVNLEIEKGEFVSLIGYTGSGKTTLVKIAAGLLAPDAGEVRMDGRAVSGLCEDCGIVFQNYSLLPWLSALENVRLAVEARFPAWEPAKQREHAERYLAMVNLANALEKRPGQLSGGMRQRVAIARAFAVEPRVLLLDEPFGALDALTRANLQQELARLCASGGSSVTVLMITNNVEEAVLLSDRIVPMTRGPKATLGPGIAVDLPRPRSSAALLRDPHAALIQASVVNFLTGFSHNNGAAASVRSGSHLVSKPHEVEAEA